MPDARCNICADPQKTKTVDGALRAGTNPSQIFDTFGEVLELSRAGIYRHAAHRARGPLDAQWLGDRPLGEPLADLAALFRAAWERSRAADEAGDSNSANRSAAVALNAVQSLQRLGVESESHADVLRQLGDLQMTVGRALRHRPDLGRELATAARSQRLPDLATTLDRLAAEYDTTP